MKKKQTILSENPSHYPIAFLDYLYVITIYSITAFFCSVIIDGYIVPDFNLQIALKRSSIFLASQILLQLAVQGFIAIFLYALLQKIYSPFNGWYGYTSETPLGLTVRNPAIISVILFYLSTSLHDKLKILFNRFSNKPQTFGLSTSNISINAPALATKTDTDTTDNTNTTENTLTNSK
jgi:hypothetical protein